MKSKHVPFGNVPDGPMYAPAYAATLSRTSFFHLNESVVRVILSRKCPPVLANDQEFQSVSFSLKGILDLTDS